MNLDTDKHETSASKTLLAAALSGLLGVSFVGCGTDTKAIGDSSGSSTEGARSCPPVVHDAGSTPTITHDAGGALVTYNSQITADAGKMSRDAFQKLCDDRGGYVYVNAACASSAMCKGLSLHDGVLWDHSCRGQNSTCAGIGCVTMPADSGLSGQDIYENGPCGNCHADWSAVDYSAPTVDYSKVNYKKYAVYYQKDVISADQALARFQNSPDKRLWSIAAWGTQGFTAEYTPQSNMPTYYQKYSLAEIKRVIAYIRALTPFIYQPSLAVFGETPGDGLPDASVPPWEKQDGGLPWVHVWP